MSFTTYQLLIDVAVALRIRVGALGWCEFPAGCYVYTGSARRNFESRIARHLGRKKALRWHIDYLLMAPGVRILDVRRSRIVECELNACCGGQVPVPGFGASDCRHGCGSHLRYFGVRS